MVTEVVAEVAAVPSKEKKSRVPKKKEEEVVAEVVAEVAKPSKEKKSRVPKKKEEEVVVVEEAVVLTGELQEEEMEAEDGEEEIDVVEITYNGITYNCDPDSMKVYDSESEFVGYWTGNEIEYRAEE